MDLCWLHPESPLWHVVEALATFVAALAAVATVGIAAYAAVQWRTQLRGATMHETAIEVLEASRLFRYLFYDARNPLYLPHEFPPGYHAKKNPTSVETADAWAHIYTARWKLLEPQMLVLARLRARAGAALGDDVADAIEALAKKGRELHSYMEDRVEQFRVGDQIVKQWTDQNWVARVRQSVEASPDRANRNDAYSREFEERFRELEAIVTPRT